LAYDRCSVCAICALVVTDGNGITKVK